MHPKAPRFFRSKTIDSFHCWLLCVLLGWFCLALLLAWLSGRCVKRIVLSTALTLQTLKSRVSRMFYTPRVFRQRPTFPENHRDP
jgi:hypothetical protein